MLGQGRWYVKVIFCRYRRLLEPTGSVLPAELEVMYYKQYEVGDGCLTQLTEYSGIPGAIQCLHYLIRMFTGYE